VKHQIKFHRIYKYQLDEDCTFPTLVHGYEAEVLGGWVRLEKDGTLHLKGGYSCDGPSGPTQDSPDSMAPAFVHDGLYQLLLDDLFPESKRGQIRKLADKTFRNMLKENEMGWARRTMWYLAVRSAGWMFS
jgi:hypothetical protein